LQIEQIEIITMRSPLSYLTLLVLILASASCILSSASCTKSNPGNNNSTTVDTASIIGTWTWAYQSGTLWDITPGDTTSEGQPIFTAYTPANTGISRTLIFDTTGTFTFIHNDSIFEDSVNYEPNYLQVALPILLLPNPTIETDTGFYQVGFGIVGCAITDTTTLLLGNVPYQALLSADTLLVHLDPCLSRVVDIYVRKN
jgi:hypothetical protein